MSSDSELEDIISSQHRSQPHFHNKGNNSAYVHKTSAMGSNQNINQLKGSKQNVYGSKGNNPRMNHSAGGKQNSFNEKRHNQNSFPPRGGGRGASMMQPRGGNFDMSSGDFDNGRFRGGLQREYNDFNGFHDRRMPDFCPPNFSPRGRHEMPFDPRFHDWAYGMDDPRPSNFGPPPFHGGPRFPPNFSGGPFPPRGYGPPGGFEQPFPTKSGPFPFQRGPFKGTPPGFQMGPPRGGMRGKGGRPYIDPQRGSSKDREDINGFHGKEPDFSADSFQPGAGPNVSYSKTGDNLRHVGTATDSTRDRWSPMSGANSPAFSTSSSSGVSLDSLDEFSSSQGYRPNSSDNTQQRNNEGRKSPMSDRGMRYEGLVGLDALGVPKGLLGDRVKNYYS